MQLMNDVNLLGGGRRSGGEGSLAGVRDVWFANSINKVIFGILILYRSQYIFIGNLQAEIQRHAMLAQISEYAPFHIYTLLS